MQSMFSAKRFVEHKLCDWNAQRMRWSHCQKTWMHFGQNTRLNSLTCMQWCVGCFCTSPATVFSSFWTPKNPTPFSIVEFVFSSSYSPGTAMHFGIPPFLLCRAPSGYLCKVNSPCLACLSSIIGVCHDLLIGLCGGV